MSTDNTDGDPKQKEALDKVDKAIHEYLEARGDIGDGKVLTAWGIVTSSTMLIDGEPAYATSSYHNPGGIPTHSWLGMVLAEHTKWLNYFTRMDDDE